MMKILCLFLLCLIISCGKSSDDKKKIVPIEPEDIFSLLERQSFSCESIDGRSCPDGIARLFMINLDDPNQSGLCTGFLTSKQRLITNAHCIPTQEQCEQTFVAIYSGGRTEIAQCGKLVKLYEDFRPLRNKALDVAIIDLDREVVVEGFKPSQQTPKLNEAVSVWVVDHISIFEGRVTELRCIMDEKSSSLIFRRCPGIAGNSGSPVLNQKNEVVAILWGSTTDESVDEFYPLVLRRSLNVRTYATDVNYFRRNFMEPAQN